MNIDTNKLREIAERATPGPLKWWTSNSAKRQTAGRGPDGGVLHATMVRRDYADVACGAADVDHISAVDPTTVLALLDQVEKLQRENAPLSTLINLPELHAFAKAVVLETTHQRERWGSADDSSAIAVLPLILEESWHEGTPYSFQWRVSACAARRSSDGLSKMCRRIRMCVPY
jgi:hypothetical protein